MARSAAELVELWVASGLVTLEEARRIVSSFSPTPETAAELAQLLVKGNHLTAFQVQVLLRGKGKSLILGNYEIKDELGKGGMGVVYKAVHRRMDRPVALKVLPAAVSKDPDLLQRFHREVKAAARLSHQNIVAAYDADEAKGTHYFVMECVEGSDLSSYVKKRGVLPVSLAVDLIMQAATGLQYAHEQGVTHRDIKPGNMLLDRNGLLKILDMGLARIEDEVGDQAQLTSTGAVMGTVDYMAPEQAVNTKDADARSDIYSLGISLYFLLTGKPAYEGTSLMARMLAHRDAQIPSLSAARQEVSAELNAVFQKMVAKKREDRYQTMAEVVAALVAIKSGTSVSPPSMTIGLSDESKLKNFLGNLAAAEDSYTETTTPPGNQGGISVVTGDDTRNTIPSGPTQLDHDGDSTPTLIAGEVSEITDPETLLPGIRSKKQKPKPKGISKSKRAASWTSPKLLISGLLGVLALILAFVFLRTEDDTHAPGPTVPPGPAVTNPGTSPPTDPTNSIGTATPAVAEWTNLFDGTNATGWQTLGPFQVKEGLLIANGGGENAISKDEYDNFELHAEWRIGSTGNGGIYYREEPSSTIQAGNEYQILDDAAYQERQPPNMQTGSLYGLIAPTEAASRPIGEWNTTRIVCYGSKVEHWLNGKQVVKYDTSDDSWKQQLAASTFGGKERIGLHPTGRILLQGHTGEVAFRSIRIRRLDAPPFRPAGERFALRIQGNPIKDYVELPPAIRFDDQQPGAVELWIERRQAKRGTVLMLVGERQLMYLQLHKDNRVQLVVVPHEQPESLSKAYHFTGGELPEGRVHLAASWNGKGGYRYYINGTGYGSGQEMLFQYKEFPTSTIGILGDGPQDPEPQFVDISQVRISSRDRFPGKFTPEEEFSVDADTLALYRFDEGSGTVLHDSSGHGYDGKIVGATWVPAAPRHDPAATSASTGGLLFDGIDDRVELPLLSLGEGPYTVEAIVRGGTQSESNGAILAVNDGKGLVMLALDPAGIPYLGRMRNDILESTFNTQTAGAASHRPTHLAGVWDGKAMQLYVDGQPAARGISGNYQPKGIYGEQTLLGAVLQGREEATNHINPFRGEIFSLRVSTVNRYQEAFRPPTRLAPDADTIALYDFSQGSGDVLKDISGNGNVGKIVGAKWVSAGSSGAGLLFSQPSDRVEVRGLPISGAAPFTVEAWATRHPSPENSGAYFPIAAFGPRLTLQFARGSMAWQFAANENGYVIAQAPSQWNQPGARSHIVGQWTGTELQLFVDGQRIVENRVTDIESVDDQNALVRRVLGDPLGELVEIGGLAIAGDSIGSNGGTIDSLRFSRGIRYQENFVPGRLTSDANTIALYDFSQGSGDVLKDVSGNGHDGKIIGATWVRGDGEPVAAVDPSPMFATKGLTKTEQLAIGHKSQKTASAAISSPFDVVARFLTHMARGVTPHGYVDAQVPFRQRADRFFALYQQIEPAYSRGNLRFWLGETAGQANHGSPFVSKTINPRLRLGVFANDKLLKIPSSISEWFQHLLVVEDRVQSSGVATLYGVSMDNLEELWVAEVPVIVHESINPDDPNLYLPKDVELSKSFRRVTDPEEIRQYHEYVKQFMPKVFPLDLPEYKASLPEFEESEAKAKESPVVPAIETGGPS
ncbi:MAG: family 16 glycoside hydrolase [Planctomycetaceae bacterium]